MTRAQTPSRRYIRLDIRLSCYLSHCHNRALTKVASPGQSSQAVTSLCRRRCAISTPRAAFDFPPLTPPRPSPFTLPPPPSQSAARWGSFFVSRRWPARTVRDGVRSTGPVSSGRPNHAIGAVTLETTGKFFLPDNPDRTGEGGAASQCNVQIRGFNQTGLPRQQHQQQ